MPGAAGLWAVRADRQPCRWPGGCPSVRGYPEEPGFRQGQLLARPGARRRRRRKGRAGCAAALSLALTVAVCPGPPR